MSAPVISTTTSVLGYKQWQAWEYQPYATNNPVSWACPNLPAGLSLDTPTIYSLTGVASTDVLTATGNTFTIGAAVVIQSLTGGAGLAVQTIYYVRDISGSTFKLSATPGGSAIDVTTDLSAGMICRLPTGKISGAASVNGVFVCGLTATNADGTSSPLVLTIGIEAASAALTSSGYEVKINVVTREIEFLSPSAGASQTVSRTVTDSNSTTTTTGTQSVGDAAPNLFAKEGDSFLLWASFQKDGQNLDLDIQSLAMALKEFNPDRQLVLGSTWKKFGSGTGAYYGIYVAISGNALKAALNNYQSDGGTAFDGLADIRWTEANPDTGSGFGPANFQFTTRDFKITVARGEV